MNRTARSITLLIYLLINTLFIAKYASRVTADYWWLVAGYLVLIPLLYVIAYRLPEWLYRRWVFWSLVALLIIAALFAYQFISQESLRVDRYEMIRLFWDNFFNGINPYTPRVEGSNIPGPFPFYFFLALPFYAVGEMGLFTLVGFLLYILLIRSYIPTERDRQVVLLALLLSPAFAWEIITRSTLFFNTALVLGYLLLVMRIDLKQNRNVFLAAFLFGLLLSTRSIVLTVMLPFLVFLGVQRSGWPKIVLWGFGIVLGFGLTFLPVAFTPGFFPSNNPFLVQNIFLPTWFPLVVLLLMSVAALRIPTLDRFIYVSMLALVFLAIAYFSLQVIQFGAHASLYEDKADISYFILALPFVGFSLVSLRKFTSRHLNQQDQVPDRR